MAKKPKQYEIDSFEKLINIINEDNFENLSTDLVHWLAIATAHYKTMRDQYPDQCKGKTNWEIAKAYFTWIDDGKHEHEIKITNPQTGEVTKSKFK